MMIYTCTCLRMFKDILTKIWRMDGMALYIQTGKENTGVYKNSLEHEASIEIWHVWLTDYYEYNESPVIQKCAVSFSDVSIDDIKEIDNAEIWNTPDRRNPLRLSFYCLVIE